MRTSLSVKLQHDAGKFWGIIIFTRSCNILSFDHDLVPKVRKVRQSQHQTHPSYNMIHAIPKELLCSQDKVTLSKFESSKRLHKGQYWSCPICWCEEHPHKVTASYEQYLRSYRIHKVAWPWASLKVQKGHTKITIDLIQDFDVENTTIKLQLDTSNLWRVIMFTRSFQTLCAWKFKKVTQRSTTWLKFWWREHNSL